MHDVVFRSKMSSCLLFTWNVSEVRWTDGCMNRCDQANTWNGHYRIKLIDGWEFTVILF